MNNGLGKEFLDGSATYRGGRHLDFTQMLTIKTEAPNCKVRIGIRLAARIIVGAHIREATAPKRTILRVILESVSVIAGLGFGGCATGKAGKLK